MDDTQKMYVVMPIYNLLEYSDAHSKISGGLWQYYRHEPALNSNGEIIDVPASKNNSSLFKF